MRGRDWYNQSRAVRDHVSLAHQTDALMVSRMTKGGGALVSDWTKKKVCPAGKAVRQNSKIQSDY